MNKEEKMVKDICKMTRNIFFENYKNDKNIINKKGLLTQTGELLLFIISFQCTKSFFKN